jgi:uncharacterized protein YjbJ (UPF0337 family)
MKRSTTDKARGEFHEVKGKVKEKVGRATNNLNLEAEGQNEKIRGKVQRKSARWRKSSGNSVGRLSSTRVETVSNILAP